MKRISIIIPNYNTKDILKDCLTSIYKTEKNKEFFEIIVIDNCSSDGSAEMVKKYFSKVKLIVNKSNLGFAKAVNQGWKLSDSEYCLFLNSDTITKSNNTYLAIVNYLDNKDNKKIGAVSGKLILRNGSIDPDTHRGFPDPWSSFTFFSGLEKIFPKSKIFAKYHMGWEDLNSIHEIEAGCGAFFAVRKKILEDINGWDEEYFFYGEDIDLCFRIRQAEWKIIYYPFIEVVHFKGASSGLRKETKDIAKIQKDNLLKVAGSSIDAWSRFYKKFYQGKYPNIITGLVLIGIRMKGLMRIIKYKYLRR